jgi:hypothetical protein
MTEEIDQQTLDEKAEESTEARQFPSKPNPHDD